MMNIDFSEYAYYGVRSLTDDENYNIGDTCRESYEWDYENDISTYDTDSPETLGGTCAVNTYIDGNWDDENEIKEKLQKTIEMVKRTYGTRKIVVIGGDYATNGMDDNEIIIEDAVVVAMI